jgi:hypothetical protein
MNKIRCTKTLSYYWGEIFVEGEEYEVPEIHIQKTRLTTNYDEYFKYTSLVAGSIDFIRDGYTQETLPQVIPGYLRLDQIRDLYTTSIDLPMITLRSRGSNKDAVSFCLLTQYEIKKKYGIDKIHFDVSIYFIDEYFDYTIVRRDKKLNSLGI